MLLDRFDVRHMLDSLGGGVESNSCSLSFDVDAESGSPLPRPAGVCQGEEETFVGAASGALANSSASMNTPSDARYHEDNEQRGEDDGSDDASAWEEDFGSLIPTEIAHLKLERFRDLAEDPAVLEPASRLAGLLHDDDDAERSSDSEEDKRIHISSDGMPFTPSVSILHTCSCAQPIPTWVCG